MKKVIYLVMAMGLLVFGISEIACAYLVTDTLEDIGPDGSAVTSRVIGDITVTINNSGSTLMGARTYDPSALGAFKGKDREVNTPLDPTSVSGSRFISTSPDQTINYAQPIIFDFSAPVLGFGLTTIDLLENAATNNRYVTLDAYNSLGEVVASQARTGPQGPSGLDLDWFIFSDNQNITQVKLRTNITHGYGPGYGLDDLVVQTVPIPSSILLLSTGVAAFFGITGRNGKQKK